MTTKRQPPHGPCRVSCACEDVRGLLRPALEFNGWFLAVFAESSLGLYLEVRALRRASPAGITLTCRGYAAVACWCWMGGRQLRPWVSLGSIIDCTAVAFNYDSNRSMWTAAGAKVTFLHSDYSRLLCASAVLCLHPSAMIVEDEVGFIWVNRQETNIIQIFL